MLPENITVAAVKMRAGVSGLDVIAGDTLMRICITRNSPRAASQDRSSPCWGLCAEMRKSAYARQNTTRCAREGCT